MMTGQGLVRGEGGFVTCLVHDSGIYVNRIRRVMNTEMSRVNAVERGISKMQNILPLTL
jgi:hypothetical protein